MRYLKSPTRIATQKVATSRATRTGTDIVEKTTLRIIDPGLILYYNFAQGSTAPVDGDFYFKDLSNNDKDATVVNTPTINDGHIRFDGVDDYATVANTYNDPVFPQGASSRTLIALWDQSETGYGSGPYNHIFHYGSTSADKAYGLTTKGGGKFNNHTWNGGAETLLDLTSGPHFGAFVYDGQGDSVYLDGTFTDLGNRTINTGNLYNANIAARISPAEFFLGDIYAILVYNRVLSTRELDHLYKTFKSFYGF
jgi:hypothetical protein